MNIAAWALAAPLVTAGVAAAARGRAFAPWLGTVGAVATLGTAVAVGADVAVRGATRQALLHAAGLEVDLVVDGASAVLLVTSGVIAVAAALYAAGYQGSRRGSHGGGVPDGFWPWLFLLLTGVHGVLLSAHVLAIYVAIELVGVAAVALVVVAGGVDALRAGLRYLVVAFGGSLVYLAGAVLLFAESGSLDLYRMSAQVGPTPVAAAALALMTVGLLVTAALFPFHFWLPDAHTLAPAPSSPVLSALVLKVYFYLVVVLWFESLPQLVTVAATQVLVVAAAGALFWGGIAALRQQHLKRLVAYSTISQMGYLWLIPAMLVEVGPGPAPETAAWYGWHGGIYYAVAHTSAKAAMLMAAGALARRLGDDHLDVLDGAAVRAPVATFAFAIAGVSLVGLPPSGGFVGKWYLLTAANASGQWWISVLVLAAGGLTAAYVGKVLQRAFVRTDRAPAPRARGPELVALGLALLTVLLGFRAVEIVGLLELDAPAEVETAPDAPSPPAPPDVPPAEDAA